MVVNSGYGSRIKSAMRKMCVCVRCGTSSDSCSSSLLVQGAAFNVTHFESRITHLLYTAINTTEHG